MSKGRLKKEPKAGNEQVSSSQSTEAAAGDAVGESNGAAPPPDLDGMDVTKRPRLSPPRTLERTLFDRLERLYGAGIKRVLNTQYR